jgi:mRNA interferase MazF
MSSSFGSHSPVRIAFKQRPAVVVSNRAYNQGRPDLVIMAITSQIRTPTGFGEVTIADWQAANLLKPSAMREIDREIAEARRAVVRTKSEKIQL